LAIDSPRVGQRVSGPTLQVSFSARSAAGGVSYRCRMDSEPDVPCTSPHVAGLRSGLHTIEVTAKDALVRDYAGIVVLVDNGDLEEAPVTEIAVGSAHSCALLANGQVRCWGMGGKWRARLRQPLQHRG
jgi:hypothetical protein